MRKHVAGRKLSRSANERKQLFRNLTRSLVERGSIVTSLTKAKAVRPGVEKLVTRAKANTFTSLKYLIAETGDLGVAQKLAMYGTLFAGRPGGYTRIIRLGNQAGDNTQKVKLEWTEKLVVPEMVTPTKPEKIKATQGTQAEKKKTIGEVKALAKPKKLAKPKEKNDQ